MSDTSTDGCERSDGELEQIECGECDWSGLYTLTDDGRIPDPCPDCDADALQLSGSTDGEDEIEIKKRYDSERNVVYIGVCPVCGIEHRRPVPADAEYAAKGCCPYGG